MRHKCPVCGHYMLEKIDAPMRCPVCTDGRGMKCPVCTDEDLQTVLGGDVLECAACQVTAPVGWWLGMYDRLAVPVKTCFGVDCGKELTFDMASCGCTMCTALLCRDAYVGEKIVSLAESITGRLSEKRNDENDSS